MFKKFTAFFGSLLLFAVLFFQAEAFAAHTFPDSSQETALIVFYPPESALSLRQGMSQQLMRLLIQKNLAAYYDHVNLLAGRTASVEDLLRVLAERTAAGAEIDLFILNTPSDASQLDLLTQDVSGASPMANVRLFYTGAPMPQSFAGRELSFSRVVLGHSGGIEFQSFFLPRLMRLWGEGWAILDAMEEAKLFSEASIEKLSQYLKEPFPVNAKVWALGQNVNITGVDFGVLDRKQGIQVDSKTASIKYNHTNFGTFSLGMIGAVFPQLDFEPKNAPGPGPFLEDAGDVVWGLMKDFFAVPFQGGYPREEIWLDGESIKVLLGNFRYFLGEIGEHILRRVEGVRLVRGQDDLKISVYLTEAISLELKKRKDAQRWELYGLELPEISRFSLKSADGVVEARRLHDIQLLAKVPLVSDRIYLREGSLNLANGEMNLEAGVLGNAIALVAEAELYAKDFKGLNFWESIERNVRHILWPLFFFFFAV
jgi:hypothetical protein